MDQYVSEIRIFGFNFAPTGWAQCNGQLLPISQNTALFSLLGTTYGGDGKSTFALPDLMGRVPLHVGGSQPGPGLSLYDLGQMSGTETVTLLESEMPQHTHALRATSEDGDLRVPGGNRVLAASTSGVAYGPANNLVPLAPGLVSTAGGSLPHENRMPYLTLNYCIALQGIFPPRP